jgi:hypothetical protein
MAADLPGGTKDRRPAVWPWLVMPIIILVVFWALRSVHHSSADSNSAAPQSAGTPRSSDTQQ